MAVSLTMPACSGRGVFHSPLQMLQQNLLPWHGLGLKLTCVPGGRCRGVPYAAPKEGLLSASSFTTALQGSRAASLRLFAD